MPGVFTLSGRSAGQAVSMATLLSRITEFHGRKVVVFGFFKVATENVALYLTREHAQHNSSSDALWLTLAVDASVEVPERLGTGMYVMVAGIVNTNVHGHMGMFPAELLVKRIAAP